MPDWAATVLIVLAAMALAFMFYATRHEIRLGRFVTQRFWRRVQVWIAVLTVAATAGAALGGSSTLTLAVAVLGALLLLVAFRLWALAKTFGPDGDP